MKAENSGNSAEVPGVDSWGWFEPVLSPAPESWPWALPNLYAVNIAPDPGVEIVGGSASPDGDLNVVTSFVRDRTRIEEIGFWRGTFGLVRRRRHPSRKDAEKEALDSFNVLRAKYLMRSGKVVEETIRSQSSATGRPCSALRVFEIWEFSALSFMRRPSRVGRRMRPSNFVSPLGWSRPEQSSL